MSSPKKFGGPKTCKIWTYFSQLPTLIANISGMRQDIPNRKDTPSRVILPAFSQTSPVNCGPSIHKVVHVSLDPPKSTFSTDYISTPRGALAPEIFTRARVWPNLGSAHRNQGRGPLKNFKGQHLKLGLKFYTCASITLGVVGITSRNFTSGCGS